MKKPLLLLFYLLCLPPAGRVQDPFAYDQPTRQLAVRCQDKKGKWHTTILVMNHLHITQVIAPNQGKIGAIAAPRA